MDNFFLVLIGVIAFKDALAVNYCSTKLCSGGQKHIACGHNGKFDPSCPVDAKIEFITAQMESALVNVHNVKRNFIAGGGNLKHPKACRMATMTWDEDLAKLASFNVKQCKMEEDKCHNNVDFKSSGQNLALIPYEEPLNPLEKIVKAVNTWYAEVKNSNATYISKYPNNNGGPIISHFAVMVAENNVKLGCSAASYTVHGKTYKNFLITCNYATSNVVGSPVYTTCSTVASRCKSTNKNYPNLCATGEVYAQSNRH